MPIVGKATKELVYRCDAASCGDQALKPHEILTMMLISVSRTVIPGVTDEKEQANLDYLSLIAETWVPLKDGEAHSYSRIMLPGEESVNEDTGVKTIVPKVKKGDEPAPKGIRITPIPRPAEMDKRLDAIVDFWCSDPRDNKNVPYEVADYISEAERGQYYGQNITAAAKKQLRANAEARVRPLIKLEIGGYNYLPAEYDKQGKLISAEQIEFTNAFGEDNFSDDKFWTEEKLAEHGYLVKDLKGTWE